MSDGRAVDSHAGNTGFRGAWSSRPWRGLLGSYAISGIGDWLYFTAFSVWLFEETGSAGWLGVSAFLRVLPYVLLGTLGGIVAERAPRRLLLVGLDVGRGGVMVLLALTIAADGPPALAVAISVVASTLTVPYRPAIVAATPEVVPEPALAAANSAEAIVGQLSVFVGPALAAALLASGSPAAAIGLDAATFLLSAVLVAAVPNRRDEASGGGHGGHGPAGDGIGGRSGWQILRSTPGLGIVIALICVSVFTFGAEGVLHVVLAEERLGRGAEFVGALTAAIGVGGLVASPLAARVARSPRPGPWLITCSVLCGAPLVVLAATRSPAVALAVLFLEGIGVILFEVLAITLVQRLAGGSLARVYGIQDSMAAATQLAGAALAPVAVGAISLEAACVLSGGVLVAFGVLGAPALLRCGDRSTAAAAEFAPITEELEWLGLFEGAPLAVVESVAASVVTEQVAAGTVVLREGDPADDLYVVRSGTFAAASLADGFLRRMGEGDWFGELGLLWRTPRTASVVAETDGEVWRIPGEAFLGAVEGLGVLPDPVRRGALIRLGATSRFG